MSQEAIPRLIDIPKFMDLRGNLSVVDSSSCLPFALKRVFYIYDIPAMCERGAHAHYQLHQFLWCVTGAVKVHTESREGCKKEFILTLPWQGLYLPPMTWASETSLTGACTYFVAASDEYNESDYIRDLELFRQLCTREQ